MKKFATLLFCAMLTLSAFAQVPDGTILQNFRSTTLDSSIFDLYSELDAGRPVLLDVSATWCAPCWSYHNGHAFKTVWDAHGPDGDNTVGMLMIEGDTTTNTNCLYGAAGCNKTTQGNWVAGTPYPITDDAYVAQTILDVGYFPTIYLVCPDRTITEIGQLSATNLYNKVLACPVASGANNASALKLETGVPGNELCGEVELSPKATILSLGTTPLTSATVKLYYAGALIQSIDWTGNLATYSNDVVVFDAFLVSNPDDLSVEVTNVNGAADDDMSDNMKTFTFIQAPQIDEQRLLIDIKTDNYGGELYWEARLTDGTPFASGGNTAVGPNGGGQFNNAPASPSAYANASVIKEVITVPAAGCYYFHIVDAYGDGMCCTYGTGHFSVYEESDVSLANPIFTVDEFEESIAKGFGTSTVFTNIETLIPSADFSVFPNPTADNLNVRFQLKNAADVSISITNTLGQVVRTIAPNTMVGGQHTLMFPVSDLSTGMYHMTLKTERGSISRKFTVLK